MSLFPFCKRIECFLKVLNEQRKEKCMVEILRSSFKFLDTADIAPISCFFAFFFFVLVGLLVVFVLVFLVFNYFLSFNN